jgi:hypothetical protein
MFKDLSSINYDLMCLPVAVGVHGTIVVDIGANVKCVYNTH